MPTDVLDLDSADATFVRAFIESTSVAFFGGGAEHAYPGFVQAMQPALPPNRYLRTPRDGYGVSYFRVVDLVNLDGNRVQVIGCEAAPNGHPNTPIAEPNRPKNHGIATAFSLTYQRQGQSPPIEQRGNQRAPSESVFGDWHALEYVGDFHNTKPESISPCIGSKDEGNPFASSPGWPDSQPQV